jgi:hypothetical protein
LKVSVPSAVSIVSGAESDAIVAAGTSAKAASGRLKNNPSATGKRDMAMQASSSDNDSDLNLYRWQAGCLAIFERR